MDNLEHLRYPIGRFEYGKSYTINDTKKNIKAIERLPKELKKITKKLTKTQLDTPYREGGWTVRQVIHHLSDSHANAYIRFKLAITESFPTIKPYDEQAWAALPAGKTASIRPSLKLLKVIHEKWMALMEDFSDADLKKGYVHPAMKRTVLLPEAIALYAWHSKHHLAHIRLVVDGKDTEVNRFHKEVVPPAVAKTATPEETPKRRGRPAAPKAAPATPAPTESTPPVEKKRPGRPAKQTAAATEATSAPAKAAKPVDKPAKPAQPEGPKMTREEVLAKARAARAAKLGDKPAKPAQPEGPKMTREEVLAKARAARAAKLGDKPAKPAQPEGPKMTREEVLAKARAARVSKKETSASTAPEAPAAPAPKKRTTKK